jgi:small subunit ribosomal protein S27e
MLCLQKEAFPTESNQVEESGASMKSFENKSKFAKVRCEKCKNEQIIFGKSTSQVKCLVCNEVLAEPTGGKADIKARVLEVLS